MNFPNWRYIFGLEDVPQTTAQADDEAEDAQATDAYAQYDGEQKRWDEREDAE